MPTPDDQRAVQEENARDDEHFWDALRDLNASSAEGHKALIASAHLQGRAFNKLAVRARKAKADERAAGLKTTLAALKAAADMQGEWLTYEQADERLGVSPEAVRQKAIRGRWQPTLDNDKRALGRVYGHRSNPVRKGEQAGRTNPVRTGVRHQPDQRLRGRNSLTGLRSTQTSALCEMFDSRLGRSEPAQASGRTNGVAKVASSATFR